RCRHGSAARLAERALRPAPGVAARPAQLAQAIGRAIRHRRDHRNGHRSRRAGAEPVRLLGHRPGAVRLLERRHLDRRAGHASPLRSQGVRPRRRPPSCLPSAPRPAPTYTQAACDRDRGRGGSARGAALRAGRRSPPDRGAPRQRVRDPGSVIWAGVVVASISCYALKLAGLSLPQAWLRDARLQRTIPLVPIALLAALVAINSFATGTHLVLDVRAAAIAVALVAVLIRAPFLVVVIAAAATAALLRLL